jgi:hypothetical protein
MPKSPTQLKREIAEVLSRKPQPSRRPLETVTAETIEDWQIRAIADAAKRATPTDRDLLNEALTALGAAPSSISMRTRWLRARAAAAAAWNARHASELDASH